ncbi:MAG: HD domain-containing protein [Anaerolineales bacterium]|nr:HD domain-containing protein [Anaerolineales bacterium]
MSIKIGYRVWQFWQSFIPSRREGDQDGASEVLSPDELNIFQQLPQVDQNHSLRVLRSLISEGESDSDLLKASLLHDLGKMKYPLRRWERVFAVLVTEFFPSKLKIWGKEKPIGVFRPLVVLQHHPRWGAELAEAAGSSSRTIWLIQNHEQDRPEGNPSGADIILLRKLQFADNNN